MEMPTQSDGQRVTGWGSYLEPLARVTTSLLVLMYGLGFIILSAHEARYGIMQFSPLRARIFFVGFTFLGFVALPAAALHYKWAYYGPLTPVVENNDPAVQTLKELFLGCGFVYTAFLIAVGFSIILMVTPPQLNVSTSHQWDFVAYIASYTGLLIIYAVIAKKFATHPKAMTVAAAVTTLTFLASLTYSSVQIGTATIGLFMAGVVVRAYRFDVGRVESFLDFRNWTAAIILVGFYVGWMFQLVRPAYGGGAPVPATIFLEKPTAWFDSTTVSVSLIDETDQGYYVLLPGKDKALFIPRNDVSSFYYGPVGDVPKKSPAP